MNWWDKQGMNYGPHSTDEALSLPMTLAQGHMANKWQGRDWKQDLLIPYPLSFLSAPVLVTPPPPARILMISRLRPQGWQLADLELAPWLLNLLISHFNIAVEVGVT